MSTSTLFGGPGIKLFDGLPATGSGVRGTAGLQFGYDKD